MSALRHALIALLLAVAAPALAQPVDEQPVQPASVGWKGAGGPGSTSVRLGVGWTAYGFTDAGGRRVVQQGVALQGRIRHRTSERLGVDFNLTWGLTDWDRARVWIDRGNQAGEWTTEHIQQVGDWAMEDEKQQGLRLMGAAFADVFLAMTYLAVPACYVSSVGGATSHLQADATMVVHAGAEAIDLWGEVGAGVLSLPATRGEWDLGVGLVAGVGADMGPVRVGARVTWSPEALHSTNRAFGDVLLPTATVSASF